MAGLFTCVGGLMGLAGLVCAAGCATTAAAPAPPAPAFAETERVKSDGDAADDIAIWAPGGLILGTDKRENGGLYVFDLTGAAQDVIAIGPLNNVDLRGVYAGADSAVAAATHRRKGRVEVFNIKADGEVAYGGGFPVPFEDPYGLCMGRAAGGRFYVGVTGTGDGFVQMRLDWYSGGGFTIETERRLAFGAQAEGCVFDDRTGDLFIAVEDGGVYRYAANPEAGNARTTIATVGDGSVVADIEGLAIYADGADGGYLLASSQGDDTFAAYALPGAAFAGRFAIGASGDGSVDPVTETDGIDVTSATLEGYPEGVFVAQDDENTGPDGGADGQNFKLVDWRDIKAALTPQAPNQLVGR